MVQRAEAALEFLAANEQLAESIEPTVTDLDNPASGLLRGVRPPALSLLPASNDVRDSAARFDDDCRGLASVAGIGTQVLAAPDQRLSALHDDGSQHVMELGQVIHVGSGHDARQRDAMTVHRERLGVPPI